jgi:nucleotide-binding universal stress UspA family protein
MYKQILVPVDGSETSDRGLSEAIGLAKLLGATLHLFHAVDLHFLYMDVSGMGNIPDCTVAMRETGEALLKKSADRARAGGVEVQTHLVESTANVVADEIVAEAARCKAELIVMGTHGRRGVRHMVMGSDAEGVVRRAPVPVLLVRGS